MNGFDPIQFFGLLLFFIYKSPSGESVVRCANAKYYINDMADKKC